MKFMPNTPRFVLPVLLVALVTSIPGQRSAAESPRTRLKGVAMERLDRLVIDLTASNQTNILAQAIGVLDATMAVEHSKEIGLTLGILERLRSGRTNEAINILEMRLDSALMGLGAAPSDARDATFQRLVQRSKEYRSKFPRKTDVAATDTAVAKVLEGASTELRREP